jgi:hypothetical protein
MGKSAPLSINSLEKNHFEHGKHERNEKKIVFPVSFLRGNGFIGFI